MVAQCVAHNIGHPEPGVFVVAQCVAQESEARAQYWASGTRCFSGASHSVKRTISELWVRWHNLIVGWHNHCRLAQCVNSQIPTM